MSDGAEAKEVIPLSVSIFWKRGPYVICVFQFSWKVFLFWVCFFVEVKDLAGVALNRSL